MLLGRKGIFQLSKPRVFLSGRHRRDLVSDCALEARDARVRHPDWRMARRFCSWRPGASEACDRERVCATLFATAPSKTDIDINIEEEDSSEIVIIQFVTFGPGVPQEALAHIFEPFYRADKVRVRNRPAELGSGLAIYPTLRFKRIPGV